MCLSLDDSQKISFNSLVALEISMHLFKFQIIKHGQHESALPLAITLMRIRVNYRTADNIIKNQIETDSGRTLSGARGKLKLFLTLKE